MSVIAKITSNPGGVGIGLGEGVDVATVGEGLGAGVTIGEGEGTAGILHQTCPWQCPTGCSHASYTNSCGGNLTVMLVGMPPTSPSHESPPLDSSKLLLMKLSPRGRKSQRKVAR